MKTVGYGQKTSYFDLKPTKNTPSKDALCVALEFICVYSNGCARGRVVGRWYVAKISYQKPTQRPVFARFQGVFARFAPQDATVPGRSASSQGHRINWAR